VPPQKLTYCLHVVAARERCQFRQQSRIEPIDPRFGQLARQRMNVALHRQLIQLAGQRLRQALSPAVAIAFVVRGARSQRSGASA